MPEKVAYKPGLDYFLKCFLSSAFGRLISVWPENFQTLLRLERLQPLPPPSTLPTRALMQVAGERFSLDIIRTPRLENTCFLSACYNTRPLFTRSWLFVQKIVILLAMRIIVAWCLLKDLHNTSRLHITEMQNIKIHSNMIESFRNLPCLCTISYTLFPRWKSPLVDNGCYMLFGNVICIWNRTSGKILSFRWIQSE